MTHSHPTSKQRWRGMIKLAAEAVAVGSTRIEQIQQQLFDRPTRLIEAVLGAKTQSATASARVIHHSIVAVSHVAIRATARTIDAVAGVVLSDRSGRSQ